MKAILLTTLFSLQALAAAPKLQPGNYEIDVSHSKVGFGIQHLMISTVDGKFDTFNGKFEINADFKKSKVSLTAETASINTANAKRDEHLRAADFFEADKNKQITFESSEIKGNEKSFKLTGDLKMKAVTKKVTFECNYLGSVNDPWGNHRAGFKCGTKIDRKDFGLTWSKITESVPVVGDEVTLAIVIEGIKAK